MSVEDNRQAPAPPIPAAAKAGGSRGFYRPLEAMPRMSRNFSVRYSRFVSLMKFLLPAVAAVLIGLVALWPHLQPQDSRFRIGFSGLKAREAEDPSMVNARYIGTDNGGQPYSITSDLAKNLVEGTNSVELEMPKADITLDDGSWLVMTADTGIYTGSTKKLKLMGAVNLFHDSGYEFHTEEMDIDLEKGIASSDQPVQGQGPFGEIEAEGFLLEDKGKVITFTGKAKMVLYPGLGGGHQ